MIKSRNSFRARILTNFIASYCGLWMLFFLLGVGVYRQSVRQSFQEQKGWLQLLAQTLLSDLQVGNVLSVERKLKQLINRGSFIDAKLTFGTTIISVAREEAAIASKNKFSVSKFLLPDTAISLEVRDASNAVWGTLTTTVDRDTLLAPVLTSLTTFGYFSLAFFFILLAGLLVLVDRQVRPLARLIDYISGFTHTRSNPSVWENMLRQDIVFDVRELDLLVQEFKAAISNILLLEDEAKLQKVQGEISKIALQVAHDIRSPLAALDIVLSTFDSVPESSRVLLNQALNRIRDIANDLLRSTRPEENALSFQGRTEPRRSELLSSLIDSILSEKRLQYAHRSGITLDSSWHAASYSLFAEVQPQHFKRVISNLINNAVESIEGSGSVTLQCTSEGGKICIRVRDSGKGIPEDVLPTLMQMGVTHGKAGGKGLGLYYARQSIESWGGTLTLHSREGEGTLAEILLPEAAPPKWFVNRLQVKRGSTFVVLDDDKTIHEVWKRRFSDKHLDAKTTLLHFSRSDDVETWHGDTADHVSNITYLIDYELLGEPLSGLQVIEKLGIAKQSILVTSRHEEPEIIEECERLRVRIMPKSVAPHVPLVVETTMALAFFLLLSVSRPSFAMPLNTWLGRYAAGNPIASYNKTTPWQISAEMLAEVQKGANRIQLPEAVPDDGGSTTELELDAFSPQNRKVIMQDRYAERGLLPDRDAIYTAFLSHFVRNNPPRNLLLIFTGRLHAYDSYAFQKDVRASFALQPANTSSILYTPGFYRFYNALSDAKLKRIAREEGGADLYDIGAPDKPIPWKQFAASEQASLLSHLGKGFRRDLLAEPAKNPSVIFISDRHHALNSPDFLAQFPSAEELLEAGYQSVSFIVEGAPWNGGVPYFPEQLSGTSFQERFLALVDGGDFQKREPKASLLLKTERVETLSSYFYTHWLAKRLEHPSLKVSMRGMEIPKNNQNSYETDALKNLRDWHRIIMESQAAPRPPEIRVVEARLRKLLPVAGESAQQ